MLPKWALWLGGAIGCVLMVVVAFEVGPPLLGCNIKANVNRSTSERIYHVPGQKYYSATRISLLRGERWFCSEVAAREAGWRKAKL